MDHQKRASIFYLDTRSLSLFRIYFGLLMCWQTVWVWSQAPVFLLDSGVLPTALSQSITQQTWPFLILFHLDGPWAIHILFLILFGCTVLFTLGYRSSLFAFIAWFLWNCVTARNEYAWHTGDRLAQVIFFWVAFLNLDAHWAVKRKKISSVAIGGIAVAGLIIQIFIEYFFAGLTKIANINWQEGYGLYFALRHDPYVASSAKWILDLGFEIIRPLGYSVLILEILFPFLLFFPSRSGWNRNLFVVLFTGFHLGIAIFLKLHSFPYISIGLLLALIPSSTWDRSQGPERVEPLRYPLFVKSILSVFLLVTIVTNVVWTNARSFPNPSEAEQFARKTLKVFGIFQNWNLFLVGRNPSVHNIVVHGTTQNGKSIDLINQAEISLNELINRDGVFPNLMWRQHIHGILSSQHKELQSSLALSVCRAWNRSHQQDQISEARIFRVSKPIPRPGENLASTNYSESQPLTCL